MHRKREVLTLLGEMKGDEIIGRHRAGEGIR